MFENLKVEPNFSPTPLELRGFSGGSLPVNKVVEVTASPTGPCRGFVDEQPDHTIVLTDFFDYLSLQVESPRDTTLVIEGPGGSWCNDDFQGKNPGIVGEWLSGTYQIWVGSYKVNDYHPYILKLSEIEFSEQNQNISDWQQLFPSLVKINQLDELTTHFDTLHYQLMEITKDEE